MQSVQISGTATYPPLSAVTQPNIPTVQAAFYLCRKPHTLRIWASKEGGPLRPVRIYGRLAWRVADIKALTGAV